MIREDFPRNSSIDAPRHGGSNGAGAGARRRAVRPQQRGSHGEIARENANTHRARRKKDVAAKVHVEVGRMCWGGEGMRAAGLTSHLAAWPVDCVAPMHPLACVSLGPPLVAWPLHYGASNRACTNMASSTFERHTCL